MIFPFPQTVGLTGHINLEGGGASKSPRVR